KVPGAERAERDREALPRGLDAAPVTRAAATRREGRGERGGELLRVGRPLQRARARRRRADRDGQWLRLDHAVRRRQVRDAAVALSGGAVAQERRWAHRRRKRRVEGPRPVDHLGHARELPSRGRQGEPAEGDQAAAQARSAGEVTNGELNARATQSAYRGWQAGVQ